MSELIAELNDSNIVVATANNIVTQSPGVAVLLNNKLEIGQRALDIARLHPRHTNNRFWSELNQHKLKTASKLARHHADLAFAHLGLIHKQAGQPEAMMFAVPGSYSDTQLSLLAGLLQAAPFRVNAIVDAAVATVAGQVADGRGGSGRYRYVDICLHQTLIAELQVTETVRQLDIRVLDGTGLDTVYDKCADVIAGLFIKQSRFDPLHHAKTEQALYNLLPACLETLCKQDEVVPTIEYEQSRYQARLHKSILADALRPLHKTIGAALNPASGDESNLLLHERVAAIPGLREQLADSEVPAPHAVFRGASLAPLPPADEQEEELHFISEISIRGAKAAPAPSTEAKAAKTPPPAKITAERATHLLVGDQAWPITTEKLYATAGEPPLSAKNNGINCVFRLQQGKAVMDCDEDAGMRLNGESVSGSHELRGGDTITSPRTDILRAIRLVGEHEQA